jgi:hypothetical protein
MIEYRPKCRDFMRSVGLEDHLVRTDQITLNAVKDKMMCLLEIGENSVHGAAATLRSFRKSQEAAAKRSLAKIVNGHY